jgi:hypothetical protein
MMPPARRGFFAPCEVTLFCASIVQQRDNYHYKTLANERRERTLYDIFAIGIYALSISSWL